MVIKNKPGDLSQSEREYYLGEIIMHFMGL